MPVVVLVVVLSTCACVDHLLLLLLRMGNGAANIHRMSTPRHHNQGLYGFEGFTSLVLLVFAAAAAAFMASSTSSSSAVVVDHHVRSFDFASEPFIYSRTRAALYHSSQIQVHCLLGHENLLRPDMKRPSERRRNVEESTFRFTGLDLSERVNRF